MVYILWATIRPQKFVEAHKIWIERCYDISKIKTIISVNSKIDEEFLLSILDDKHGNFDIKIFETVDRGVCGPAYDLTSKLEFEDNDIIIFASDDFLPPLNFDIYLNKKFDNRSGVLFVQDGYQAADSSNMLHPAITCPIMTGEALKKMNNIIYHPAYLHMFSDCELYLTTKELGILIDERLSDNTIFEHRHWVTQKRQADQNDQIYYNNWKRDENVWNKRKLLPVSERIKV